MALSLLPIMTTYFAYGNATEIALLLVAIVFELCLIYAMRSRVRIPSYIFFVGLLFVITHTWAIKGIWLDSDIEGEDPVVAIVFTTHLLFSILVVYFLLKMSILYRSRSLEK